MPTCLVTGGAGFVGSHIVEALVRRGDRVRVLDNFDTGQRANLQAVQGRIELIEGSVADPAAVAKAVSGCDVVFHQAALASVPRSIDDPLATHAVCATGTLIVLDEARKAKVRRVVYAASSSAYGNQPQPQKRETDLPSPLSPYAAAKLAAELYCEAFYHSFGLEAVALRYFNVFGPRQDPSGPYAAVIPIFIKKILAASGRRSLATACKRAISRTSRTSCRPISRRPRPKAPRGRSSTLVTASRLRCSICSRS